MANNAMYELRLCDCVAGMAGLSENSIDVVVTSPPYNIGTKYGTYNDCLPRNEYLAWTGEWFAEVKRVLHPDGSLFVNVGSKPTDPWIAHDVAIAGRSLFCLQNEIHWVKSIAFDSGDLGSVHGVSDGLSVGHYKPINSSRFLHVAHENVFHFTHRGDVELDRLAIGVPYADKSNVNRWGKEDRGDSRCRGNVWFIPYCTVKSRKLHPAAFPVKLPELCIKLHGLKHVTTVLDPFVGIGASGIACQNLGVERFIGFEVDAHYLAEARKRISD